VDFLQLAARVSASPQPAGDAAPRNPFQLDDPEALRETIVCGSPDTCADAIAALADLGIEYLLFFVNLGGMPHEDVMRSLRLFASEVMPRFRS
jgi:alkanesulfonate monooxygenase SsuD/methylene tetrahydromethanopterin reductase-like flavin-dependent oxidoreductase (luciferase family)